MNNMDSHSIVWYKNWSAETVQNGLEMIFNALEWQGNKKFS